MTFTSPLWVRRYPTGMTSFILSSTKSTSKIKIMIISTLFKFLDFIFTTSPFSIDFSKPPEKFDKGGATPLA